MRGFMHYGSLPGFVVVTLGACASVQQEAQKGIVLEKPSAKRAYRIVTKGKNIQPCPTYENVSVDCWSELRIYEAAPIKLSEKSIIAPISPEELDFLDRVSP